MSVIVIDPSARNLPEQVLKNTQDLNDLQTAIDELTKVLPDIMGRSPATYVAPVALDSEAKPAGQYHLLFANTSYDVKNGDYVFCVFVHAASGSSYVGVLQVVNDTYASGQYAATVTAVTPNLRGNDGATGQPGASGQDAIMCKNIEEDTAPQVNVSRVYLTDDYFNRPIGQNTQFNAIWINTADNNHPYLCRFQSVSPLSPYQCNVIEVNDMRGAQGQAGKEALYFTNGSVSSVNNPVINGAVGGITSGFNRTPEVGDVFIGIVTDTSKGVDVVCVISIDSLGSQSPTWNGTIKAISNQVVNNFSELGNPSTVIMNDNGFRVTNGIRWIYPNGNHSYNFPFTVPIKATNGIVADVSEDGNFIELHAELYRHHIGFTNGMGMSFNFDIYNRSATQFTYDTLKSYLTGKTYSVSGGESMSSTKIPSHISTLNNVITVTYTDTSRYQLEETSVAINDTVEEI